MSQLPLPLSVVSHSSDYETSLGGGSIHAMIASREEQMTFLVYFRREGGIVFAHLNLDTA